MKFHNRAEELKLHLKLVRHKETGIWISTAAAAKSLQSCPTLCDPTDGSPPGSPVPGILLARTLEWVAISFSSALSLLKRNSRSNVSRNSGERSSKKSPIKHQSKKAQIVSTLEINHRLVAIRGVCTQEKQQWALWYFNLAFPNLPSPLPTTCNQSETSSLTATGNTLSLTFDLILSSLMQKVLHAPTPHPQKHLSKTIRGNWLIWRLPEAVYNS